MSSKPSYQLFDPEQSCKKLLPLNPVEYKITFHKVSVFDVSLDDIDDIAKSSANYARYIDRNPAAKMRLGLPVSTLFSRLRSLYQEVRCDIKNEKIPVIVSIEGSFLPFDPKNTAEPLREHSISLQSAKDGLVIIDGMKIKIKEVDKIHLFSKGDALVTVRGKTVRLKLDGSLPVKRTAVSPHHNINSNWMINNNKDYIFDFLSLSPDKLSDDLYKEAATALLAYTHGDNKGVGGTERMAETVAQLSAPLHHSLLQLYKNDKRFRSIEAMLRPRLQHSRPNLPRYDIGLFSIFEQTWVLQGYSRGALVNSLTLGPEEELTIEIVTFDRRRVEEERILSKEFEASSELTAMENITSKLARELSESNQVAGDIGLGLTLPIEGIPVNLSVNGSASNAVKADIQASMEHISEATSKVSERVKATRQVKVVEARETGREDRVTRKLRNPNQGYALTLNCYEVLENYKVKTALKNTKQFCLIVEQPFLGIIDVPFILAYEDRLQNVLLSKNYLSGFLAARNLYAHGWFDKASIQKVEITEAANQSVAIQSPPRIEKPIVIVAKQLKDVLQRLFDVNLLEAAKVLAEYYNPLDGIDITETAKAKAESSLGRFNYALKLKIISQGIEDRARIYISAVDNAIKEANQESNIALALGSFLSGADDEWLTNLKMVAASLVSAQLASMLLIPFPVLAPVLLTLAVVEDNAGYPGIVGKAKQELKVYETAASVILPAPEQKTASVVKTKEAPPQLFSLQELAMAHADFDALRLHVEANRVYYMNKIWKAEDPNARFERFRQMGIESYVENRLIGFVGDRAIFPLRLSSLNSKVREILEKKLTSFKPEAVDAEGTDTVGPIKVEDKSFSLPTSAVYMDGILGQCELLEPYLVQRRDIERRIAQAEAEMSELRVADARAKLNNIIPKPVPT